ncbi:MAG: SMC-Scp complex subunit ScpB [Dehalococcoidia bacterium]
MTLSEAVPEERLEAALESLLFVSAGPVEVLALGRAVGHPVKLVRRSLEALAEQLNDRGLRLQWNGDVVQLATDPDVAEIVSRFLGENVDSQLSRGALETLAIVAFKQPVTRHTVDIMRGVNSDYMIGKLKERGLIEEIERSEGPGRPWLYGTTLRFLEHFGLQSVRKLVEDVDLPEPAATADPGEPAVADGELVAVAG